ncbi:transmembrane protein 126 [Temnothorax americanus]|uniref:transmembrane protein 126 n=1 Tax=Temnothorax americanus TaxID=1964332 RepID=UPI004067FAF3
MDISRSSQYIIRDAQQQDTLKNTVPRYETIAEQYRIIRSWRPRSDVWPLTTGRAILVSVASLTGVYINYRFRAKLKLRDYGALPTMLGLAITPAIATGLSHTEFILNKLLSLEISCPLCLETRSALAQTCTGLFLPLIMAPVANFQIAAGSGVYNVPHITDVRKTFGTILSAYQPLFPKIAMIFVFQALLAGFITYLEIRSFLRIIDIQYLMQEEKKQKLKQKDVF